MKATSRELIQLGEYDMSAHAMDEMAEDDLDIIDVECAILGGRVRRVETDDPDGDWTRPGVFDLGGNVFRIPLPLPFDGLRAVNIYAIADDDGLVLIDSGWAIAEARAALSKALAALDRGLADVRRFLVTHIHRDHYAMAVAVRREFGSMVSLGVGERQTITRLSEPGHLPMEGQWALLARCGATDLVAWLKERAAEVDHDPADWAAPDDWLANGMTVVTPRRTLEVVETPGHTQGHVVFVDDAAGLLFAGDHVLPHITPSIGFDGGRALPLGDYSSRCAWPGDDDRRRCPPTGGSRRRCPGGRAIDHHGRLDQSVSVIGSDARRVCARA
jgi:glyoxylase-like metal-dependent hydrolase (beta-lactamase superfamily II)